MQMAHTPNAIGTSYHHRFIYFIQFLPIYSDDLQIDDELYLIKKDLYVVYVGLVPFMMSWLGHQGFP